MQVFVHGQSSARQNGFIPFSPRHRTTDVALVKATKEKANLATDQVHMENWNMVRVWSQSGNNRKVARLLIPVGKICPLVQEHFLSPLLKRKALLTAKQGFKVVQFSLKEASGSESLNCDFLLSANTMVSCNVLSHWTQLVSSVSCRMF